MTIKFNNKAIEFGFRGYPNDELWERGWRVRLARRFFTNSRFSFYIMFWNV